MVNMKSPTIKLLFVCICSYILLFVVSSSLKAEEVLGSTATFYVQWYDVGKKALVGLEGVNKVTIGFRYFREIDTVYYDPTVITVEEMEEALKKAGTYVGTEKSPWFFVGVINPINRITPLKGKGGVVTSQNRCNRSHYLFSLSGGRLFPNHWSNIEFFCTVCIWNICSVPGPVHRGP